MKKIILLSLIVFLTGCAAQSKKICNEFGFKAGSLEFANCVKTETHRSQDAWADLADDMERDRIRAEHHQLLRDLFKPPTITTPLIRSPLNGLTCTTSSAGPGRSITRCD